MADDPLVAQQPVDVTPVEPGDAIDVEPGKTGAEVLPFPQDRQPAQARLEPFQAYLLEQTTVVVDRSSPLFIVVLHVQRIAAGPPTSGHCREHTPQIPNPKSQTPNVDVAVWSLAFVVWSFLSK